MFRYTIIQKFSHKLLKDVFQFRGFQVCACVTWWVCVCSSCCQGLTLTPVFSIHLYASLDPTQVTCLNHFTYLQRDLVPPGYKCWVSGPGGVCVV